MCMCVCVCVCAKKEGLFWYRFCFKALPLQKKMGIATPKKNKKKTKKHKDKYETINI